MNNKYKYSQLNDTKVQITVDKHTRKSVLELVFILEYIGCRSTYNIKPVLSRPDTDCYIFISHHSNFPVRHSLSKGRIYFTYKQFSIDLYLYLLTQNILHE